MSTLHTCRFASIVFAMAASCGCNSNHWATSGRGGAPNVTVRASRETRRGDASRQSSNDTAPRSAPLDGNVRLAVIEGLAQHLESEYVFEHVGARLAQLLQERLQANAYDTIQDTESLALALGHRRPPYTQIVGAIISLDATRRSYTVDFEPDADEPEGGIAFRVAARGAGKSSELCIDDVAIRQL